MSLMKKLKSGPSIESCGGLTINILSRTEFINAIDLLTLALNES